MTLETAPFLDMTKLRVCWQVVSVNPYHSARMTAFAHELQVPPVFLELTDKDTFQPLEHPGAVGEAYGRRTLFAGRQYSGLSSLAIRRSIRNSISNLKPGVVCLNGWGMRGSIETLKECLRLGIPTVLMSESTTGDKPRAQWREKIKRRIVRTCSAALVGGRPHVEYVSALGIPRDRIFMGYNVVDNQHFWQGTIDAHANEQVIRKSLELPNNYFLACSRFGEKKNLFRLMKAYSAYKLAMGRKAWKLIVLGDGELKNQLFSARSHLALSEDVIFPGFKHYDELPMYYAFAGAFVHASTSEPWGLVVNEAMAASLPVLVSNRCGCAPELVRDGQNGWTFDPIDVEALTNLLIRMSESTIVERLSMGRASREIIGGWTPHTFANSLRLAIQAAIAAPPPTLDPIDRALLCFLGLL